MSALDVPRRAFGALSGHLPKVRRLGVLDIETWGLDARPSAFALGAYVDEAQERTFTSVDEMRSFLLSPQTRGRWLFAHNGGRFDYYALFGNYLKEYPRTTVIVGGRLIVLKIPEPNGKHTHRFCDSYNLITRPLAAIGDALGYPKGTTPDKFKNADRVRGLVKEDFDYCLQDCRILYRALDSLQMEIGELAPTLPSLAMKLFRRRYMKETIWVPTETDLRCRPAYYGGRTEAYFIGKLCFAPHYYDINSLYPQAMISARFPNPSFLFETGPIGPPVPDDVEGVAHARVTIPPCYVPPLPHRRADNELLFPCGTFEADWTLSELRLVEEIGGKVGIKNAFVARPLTTNPFVEYVSNIYNRKQKAGGFARDVYKLLLNGLYGKFGEFHKEQTEYSASFNESRLAELQAEHGDVHFAPLSSSRSDGFYTWGSKDGGVANHSVYVWAAYITAKAREINWRTQMLLLKHGIHTLYTDTDSFVTDGCLITDSEIPALSGLIGDGLGQLKVEDKIVTAIWGAKHYETDEGRVLKGVKKGAEQNADGSWSFDGILGARAAIRKGLVAGSPTRITRGVRHAYSKRFVFPDGTTKPFELSL